MVKNERLLVLSKSILGAISGYPFLVLASLRAIHYYPGRGETLRQAQCDKSQLFDLPKRLSGGACRNLVTMVQQPFRSMGNRAAVCWNPSGTWETLPPCAGSFPEHRKPCCNAQEPFRSIGNLAAVRRNLSAAWETLLQCAGTFPQHGKPCS